MKIKSLEDENVFLKEAINKIWEVASGESQVAMDDTAGMEWISDYTSSLWDNDSPAERPPLPHDGNTVDVVRNAIILEVMAGLVIWELYLIMVLINWLVANAH